MIEELQLAELLCTRLCHDLTGPIGAVNNGAEFLSEEGFDLKGQAVELIVSSAFSAVTRLQFYRMAYGKVRDQGEVSLAEKQKLAVDFFADSKITLDWPDSHTDASGISVSQRMSRLIFNLLIVASGVLIRGGTIMVRIGQNEQGQKLMSVSASGAGMKWDAEIDKIFAGKITVADLSPKNVQIYLTRRFADDLHATISCRVSETEAVIEVLQS
ncbi:MAG: hypothetical protein KGJ06_07215 [Pseudomonadota bacterium]|nr:hypothetical protein [Pseudomonadota bacterium]